jgi:hypothetical protein
VTKYLISFPSAAMQVSQAELPAVGNAARAVVEQAKRDGVYAFAGGIHEGVDSVRVGADGTVSSELYPDSRVTGGFTALELLTLADAFEWASRMASACPCDQELRGFMYDQTN